MIHLQSGVAFEGRKALEFLTRTVTRASANHHTMRYVVVLHRLGVLIVHIHQLVHDLTRALCHHLRQLNYYIRGWILIFKSFAAGRRAFSVGHDKGHHSYLYWDPLHLISANNKNNSICLFCFFKKSQTLLEIIQDQQIARNLEVGRSIQTLITPIIIPIPSIYLSIYECQYVAH